MGHDQAEIRNADHRDVIATAIGIEILLVAAASLSFVFFEHAGGD